MSRDREDFMGVLEHLAALVNELSEEDRGLYFKMKNTRPEVSFRDRSFVVYQIEDRRPKEIDNLRVMDFLSNDEAGSSCEILSTRTGIVQVIGYTPVRMFGYNLFMHLPLHGKLRWSAGRSDVSRGSLAFDILLRTSSRLNPRERGVTHCETGVDYAKEFEGLQS